MTLITSQVLICESYVDKLALITFYGSSLPWSLLKTQMQGGLGHKQPNAFSLLNEQKLF